MPRPKALPIWSNLTGGMDQSLPAGHPRYPQHRSPDLLNVLVREGVNRKWPGRVRYGGAGLGAAPRFLCSFLLSTGTQYLIASDGRQLYRLESDGSSWDTIGPVYDSGTVSKTAGSAVVTGAGTTWVTALLEAGDLLHGPDGLDYEIQSVDSETQLTLTTAPAAAWSGGLYNIHCLLKEGGVDRLRGVVADDQLVLVNGVDRPWLYAPLSDPWHAVKLPAAAATESLGASCAPPAARFATTFHLRNLLVFANISDDPQRVWHSDAGDYTRWSGGGLEATYDFHAMSGDIMGLDGGHEFLFVFFQNGIWRGVWSGTDVKMEWAQVPSSDGVAYPNSLLRLGAQGQALQEGALTQWVYLGQSNIYLFNGESVRPIGDPIRRWVFDQIDTNYPDRVQGIIIPEWHLALWSFPAHGTNGLCTHSLAFDYETGEWFPSGIGYPCLGRWDLSVAEVTWDSLTGTLDAQTRRFDEPGAVPQPVTLAPDDRGYLYYLDLTAARDREFSIPASRTTPILTPGDGDAVEVAEIAVATEAAAGTRLAVELQGGERNAAGAWTQYEEHQLTVDDSGEARTGYVLSAKSLQVRVTNGEPDQGFGLTSITPYLVKRGR